MYLEPLVSRATSARRGHFLRLEGDGELVMPSLSGVAISEANLQRYEHAQSTANYPEAYKHNYTKRNTGIAYTQAYTVLWGEPEDVVYVRA